MSRTASLKHKAARLLKNQEHKCQRNAFSSVSDPGLATMDMYCTAEDHRCARFSLGQGNTGTRQLVGTSRNNGCSPLIPSSISGNVKNPHSPASNSGRKKEPN